jgi:glycosyltransferase involved in cell wall biosynthesis
MPDDDTGLPEQTGVTPNVLVMGIDLPHLGSAGGILLHRLFQGWPLASLLALGPALAKNTEALLCRFEPYQPPYERVAQTRFCKLVRLLRLLKLLPVGRLEQHMPDDFKPAVLVHVLSSLGYSEAAYDYSLRFNVPLVLIVHDDPEEFNESYSWASQLIRERFRRIYRHASRRLCISPEMERTLHDRYGVEGEVMYPNRNESTTPRPVETSRALKKPGTLTLGYAGGLNYGYGQRLAELVPILRESGIIIHVYGGSLPSVDCGDVVVNMGRISPPEHLWERVKTECDAVLLPYCYANHGHQELYRTHFPSKLPEYLALGMPVIISGPDYATGVRWGLQNPAACLVINDREGHQWKSELVRLRDDPNLRMQLSINAVEAGNRDFEPTAIRTKFQKIITQVASIS